MRLGRLGRRGGDGRAGIGLVPGNPQHAGVQVEAEAVSGGDAPVGFGIHAQIGLFP
jgi:hypothetical protein